MNEAKKVFLAMADGCCKGCGHNFSDHTSRKGCFPKCFHNGCKCRRKRPPDVERNWDLIPKGAPNKRYRGELS